MPTLLDGSVFEASAVSIRRFSTPFRDNVLVMFDQDFMQLASRWKPLPLDTKDKDLQQFVLVDESALSPIGNGMARWTRTYARLPAERDEFESYVFTYPGMIGSTLTFSGGPAITIDAGRESFSTRVTARLHMDFWHVGFSPGIKTPQDIPIIEAFEPVINTGVAGVGLRGFKAALLGSNTVPTAQEYATRMRTSTVAAPVSPFGFPSFPIVTGAFEIVAEDSVVSVWMGNIWQRVTRYVPVL